jgi:hypothetical protein
MKLDFPFIPVPIALMPRDDLEWIDKVLVGRILSFGDEACFLSQVRMAAEFGVHRQRINERLTFLESRGVIRSVRSRRGKTYQVLCDVRQTGHQEVLCDVRQTGHQEVLCDVRQTGHQEEPAELQMSAKPDSQMSAKPDSRCPLNRTQRRTLSRCIEKNQSSSSVVEGGALAETTDDESHFSERTEPEKTEDLDSLVSVARDQIRAARAAGAGVPLEQIGSPDREITTQILAAFSDGADFETWLESTVIRGVARKAKSATWGLFLTDAKNQAEDLRLKRESEEKRERDWQIEQERRQEEEFQHQTTMHTLMLVGEAAALVGRVVPWPLRSELERTRELISPKDLEACARDWKRCDVCHDDGAIGNLIDKTLAFCGCVAGIEAQYRDGADWPARETERVHTGVKALLVEACRELNRQFAGDALEAANVIDDGENLEITPATAADAICVTDADVKEALGRVRWQRVVRIIRPGAAMPADEARVPVNGTVVRDGKAAACGDRA